MYERNIHFVFFVTMADDIDDDVVADYIARKDEVTAQLRQHGV